MDKSKLFYIWEGLEALGMLIVKIDWVRYNIRKYIFIGNNSRSKATISTIKVMKIVSLKDLPSLIKKKMEFHCLRRQLQDYSSLRERRTI